MRNCWIYFLIFLCNVSLRDVGNNGYSRKVVTHNFEYQQLKWITQKYLFYKLSLLLDMIHTHQSTFSETLVMYNYFKIAISSIKGKQNKCLLFLLGFPLRNHNVTDIFGDIPVIHTQSDELIMAKL